MELPPHARRRGLTSSSGDTRVGITSACAEKSADHRKSSYRSGNYLRMRGEEPGAENDPIFAMELPPHARRRDPA